MTPPSHRPDPGASHPTTDRAFFGHPRGLGLLFMTEMWERFSFYGLRPLLVLFMAAALADGGFGFDRPAASAIVGIYAASVYLASLPGGWIADRWLGLRRAILIGALLITAGHLSIGVSGMAGPDIGKIFFFLGLVLIVLGTGPVCHAAGVDLFLDIARIVLSTPASRDALFVWSGPGYDPRDGGYGALLQKRLRHTGLESRVILLPPTSASAALNGLADIVILPARADPLSLSGVAALRAGRPVLCFENGCSLAEYLEQDGLADPCLAPYLDVSVLADRILTLAAAPDRRAAVGARGAALAVSRFGPRSQARAIAALALSPAVGSDPETDAAVICESPTFDPAFCGGAVAQAGTRADAARAYLYAARTGFGLRKPEPGFNPAIFADLYGGRGDPYADFLRARRPAGPWSVPVIRAGEDSAAPSAAPLRAALHIHAYHPDQLADIAARLACNAARPDLFVSVADAAGLDLARAVLADGTQAALEIRWFPMSGAISARS